MGLKCIIEAPVSAKGRLKSGTRTLDIDCAKEHIERINAMDVRATYVPYGSRTDKPSVIVDIVVTRPANKEKNISEESIVTLTPRNCILQDVDVPKAHKAYFIDSMVYRAENGTEYRFKSGQF